MNSANPRGVLEALFTVTGSCGGLNRTTDLLGQSAWRFIEQYRAFYGSDPVGSYPIYAVAALQTIIAAIEQSPEEVTRSSLIALVLKAPGLSISASQSILGRSYSIDPNTGDTSLREITLLRLINYRETTQTNWVITP